jgi:hypothetical protein
LKWIYTMHNQHDDDNEQWLFHQLWTKGLKNIYVHGCLILRNKAYYKYPTTLAVSTLIILFYKILKYSKIINYLTNRCQSCQGTIIPTTNVVEGIEPWLERERL